MTLSSLLVSRDWSEVSVLECILGGLHIAVDVEPEPERARAKLARTKVDALIVDCDLAGTADFLNELNDGLNTVPLVIISSANGRNRAKESDATFVFEKPISVEQAVHTLSAARNMILDGRLRYHRHTLGLPVYVQLGPRKRVKASLLNLSQGGVAVRPCRPTPITGAVRVDFELPGAKAGFKIQGEVVWDKQGNTGIRFAEMSRSMSRDLQLWLARQYLTH
ncbi:MAG: PilZ domain-containing protein [Terriglobales bacterium]